MSSNKIKKIHFVGIKGVGMTPLAIIAKEAGFDVSGSDVEEDFITKEALEKVGIEKIYPFSPYNIDGMDLVIITAAHKGFENEEAIAAKEKGILVMTQAQALSVFSDGSFFKKSFNVIAVAGSHGKTTTTAMIATVLKSEGMDPSYMVGTGEIPTLDGPGHLGKGKYFVCEADEYISFDEPKFLSLSPKIAVITNIDFDHPDVYADMDAIHASFLKFAEKISLDGVLIICGDGVENARFVKSYTGRKITYGMNSTNDYFIDKISFEGEKTFFWVKHKDSYLGQFSLNTFGEQNALDGLAAIVATLETGLSIDNIRKGLSTFKGSKRRSQFIGNTKSGAILYDDYAHHPVEISKTLDSFRKNFPKHKIIPIFQPHMYSRTKYYFDDFVRSFDKASDVVITEIFPSFREERDENYSSKLISDAINKRVNNKSVFIKNMNDVVEYLNQKSLDKNSIIITMGAGDIYKIHDQILA